MPLKDAQGGLDSVMVLNRSLISSTRYDCKKHCAASWVNSHYYRINIRTSVYISVRIRYSSSTHSSTTPIRINHSLSAALLFSAATTYAPTRSPRH